MQAYQAAWRELEGTGTQPPSYAQEGRHAHAASQALSEGPGGSGFYGTNQSGVLPSPPRQPRTEQQLQGTPRQLRQSTNGQRSQLEQLDAVSLQQQLGSDLH